MWCLMNELVFWILFISTGLWSTVVTYTTFDKRGMDKIRVFI